MSVDWLVLTAANAAQGRGYGAQLRAREDRGTLPMRWMVVADPMDRRAGSGGSTFAVLYEIARRLAEERKQGAGHAPLAAAAPGPTIADLFRGLRILIIHSGGDSRRLPAYAAQGKVFTPLPSGFGAARTAGERGDRRHDGADLFDLVLEDLSGVPLPESGRVLIGTGDVVLGVAKHRPRVDARGVVGVAFPTDVERGSRHGVYVCEQSGRVVDFLQKPTSEVATKRGAIRGDGRVLVDCGLVSLDPETVEKWLGAAGVGMEEGRVVAGPGILSELQRGWGGAIDLYHHVLGAIPERVSREAYLSEVVAADDPEAAVARQRCGELHDRMHGQAFSAAVVPDCDFLHVGTSRELLEVVGGAGPGPLPTPSAEPKGARRKPAPGQPARVYNSSLEHPAACKGPAVIEACEGFAAWRLGGDNIVVGVPAAAGKGLKLARGWGVVCMPVGARDWAAAVFGDRDDGKTDWRSGGTFGNAPLASFLKKAKLDPKDLWKAGEQSLWTARLWPSGPADRALRAVQWMMDGKRAPAAWKRARRLSLAELLGRVNQERIIAHRAELQRRDRLSRIGDRLRADPDLPARAVAEEVRNETEARGVGRQIGKVAEAPGVSELARARLLKLADIVRKDWPRAVARVGRVSGTDLEREAFASVARAVAGELEFPRKPPAARTLPDQVVWVTTPVRIDFHGGWSDTPPVCQELGGSVVNGAITLNGQYPVQVMARVSDEPRIRLSSVDLGKSVSLANAGAVCAFSDPHDWAALPKAALVLAGMAPSDPRQNLKKWLERFGGGLDLTIFAALPKGSGLGTSSVLGAAILACLDRVLGREVDVPSLIRRTSLLEQMMSTAGGWQDQAGGITPGVKLLTTQAGPDQVPRITRVPLGSGAGTPLSRRMLLYYTGQRRLAKNILQNVVSRYLAREPATLRIIARLKEGAEGMRQDLERGDVEAFARGVLDFWECKKAIDPGATNKQIEAIIGPIAEQLSGYELPGAGGGGFVFMIAKDLEAAAAVRERLTKKPPNRLARFYDFAIDQKGLAVAVL